MTARPKVFYLTAAAPRGLVSHHTGTARPARQCHAIVAVPSRKAAAAAFGCSLYALNTYGSETRNADDIATATADPGVVFVRPLDARGLLDGYQRAHLNERGSLVLDDAAEVVS